MRLHLVDGTFELFRAHFSPRPRRTDAGGREITATVGLVASLLALVDDEDVTHIAVAFDNPIESFRNALFEGYKDSSGVEEELLAQFDGAEDAVGYLGMTVWSMAEHEADDALATAAARYKEAVEQVRICTPDKDLGQAVEGRQVVLVDRMRDRVIDEDAVRERFGVGPGSIPDYLALVGDAADGIPGIKGFGKKTASTLLARYGHLEGIPEHPEDWEVEVRGSASLAERLGEQRDDAVLYRTLATLVTDVELAGGSVEDFAWDGVPKDPYLSWCEQAAVAELKDRPSRWKT